MTNEMLVICALSAPVFATTARAQQSSTHAEISDDVVKIGVLNDMSSLYSDTTGKGSLTGAQMAVTDFGGHVRGKPVEVIGADHQNKPDIGSTIARTWFDTNKVDVIVDVPTSSVALAVQQITRERNRVFLISGAGASDLTGPACSPNGIHWTYDSYALSTVAGNAMTARGEDTWFFVTAEGFDSLNGPDCGYRRSSVDWVQTVKITVQRN
jgi:branched-chain amino acid transport system substrate-binding protein